MSCSVMSTMLYVCVCACVRILGSGETGLGRQ